MGYSQAKEGILYADEAELLNIVLFGCTSKQWREANPTRVLKGENIRDMASINDLAILSNLESLNSILIKNGVIKKDRFKILRETVNEQRRTLDSIDFIKTITALIIGLITIVPIFSPVYKFYAKEIKKRKAKKILK